MKLKEAIKSIKAYYDGANNGIIEESRDSLVLTLELKGSLQLKVIFKTFDYCLTIELTDTKIQESTLKAVIIEDLTESGHYQIHSMFKSFNKF